MRIWPLHGLRRAWKRLGGDMADTPTRNTLLIIAHGDQRAVKFFEDVGAAINANGSGDTRPTTPFLSQQHYDTVLLRPIWWNGTIWTDALGVAV